MLSIRHLVVPIHRIQASLRRYSSVSPFHPGEPLNGLNGTAAVPAAPSVPDRQASIGVEVHSGLGTQQQSEANEDLAGEDRLAHGDNIDCAVSPTVDWGLVGSSTGTESVRALPGGILTPSPTTLSPLAPGPL